MFEASDKGASSPIESFAKAESVFEGSSAKRSKICFPSGRAALVQVPIRSEADEKLESLKENNDTFQRSVFFCITMFTIVVYKTENDAKTRGRILQQKLKPNKKIITEPYTGV